jgi:hypothetical protein
MPMDIWKPAGKVGREELEQRRKRIYDRVIETIKKTNNDNEKNYNKRFKLMKFKKGELVLVYNYYAAPLQEKWIGPFEVVEENNGAMKIKEVDGSEFPKNMNRTVNTKNVRRYWRPVVVNKVEDEEDGSEPKAGSDESEREEVEEPEITIEKVINHKKTINGWKLLAKFEGEENNRWIPIENFADFTDGDWLINEKALEYVRKVNKKGATIPVGERGSHCMVGVND